LFNVVDNCEQCGQQNIVQSCFHQHCNNLIVFSRAAENVTVVNLTFNTLYYQCFDGWKSIVIQLLCKGFQKLLAPLSDMGHKVTARDSLSKPLTQSSWAAFFANQLSSPLQIRIISTYFLLLSEEMLSTLTEQPEVNH
jgi:hypothetical protein